MLIARSRWDLGTVVDTLAGLAAGILFFWWGIACALGPPGHPTGEWLAFDILDYLPVLTVLALSVAIGGGVVGRLLRRPVGWAVAAAGFAVVASANFLVIPSGPNVLSQELWAVSVATGMGVAVGGVCLTVEQAERFGRMTIGLAFVVGALFESVLIRPLTLLGRGWSPDAGLLLPLVVLTALVAVAAVVRRKKQVGGGPQPAVGPQMWPALCAGMIVIGNLVCQAVLERVKMTDRAQETFREVWLVGIGVAVGLILAVVAFRRGKADLARWALVGSASAPSLLAALKFELWRMPVAMVALAIGIAAGAFLANRHDRVAPWDAVGVAVSAAGLLLLILRSRWDGSARDWFAALLLAGLGLGLSAGLVRLVRQHREDDQPLAGGLALGIAGLALGAQAFSLPAGTAVFNGRFGDESYTLPVTMAATCVAMVMLFRARASDVAGTPAAGGTRRNAALIGGCILLVASGVVAIKILAVDMSTDLNRPKSDGRLEYTVKSVQCSPSAESSQTFGPDPQKCLAATAVKNLTADVWNLSLMESRAISTEGCSGNSVGCSMSSSGGSLVGDEEIRIAPGATVDVVIAFVMPKNATLNYLLLGKDVEIHLSGPRRASSR